MLPEHLRLLSSAPEVAVGKDGKPLTSAELVVIIFATREGAESDEVGSNLNVRGVGPTALELHPPKQLEGRMFTPGTSEIVIGKAIAGRFKGMRLGGQVKFARRDWTVVGVADQGGSAYDSEVWGDVEQFEDAFARWPRASRAIRCCRSSRSRPRSTTGRHSPSSSRCSSSSSASSWRSSSAWAPSWAR
jgi:putative ABC transport system permease protein